MIELIKDKISLIFDVFVGVIMVEINISWAEILANYFSMENLENYSKIFGMLAGGVYFIYRIIVYHYETKNKKLDNEIKREQLKDLKQDERN